MKPIRTLQTNFVYHAPPGMPDCDPLPVTRTSDGRTISVWEFTPEERLRIAAGENLELHVWQQPPSPVGVQLTKLTAVADDLKSTAPAPLRKAIPGPPSPPMPPGPRPVG